MVAAAHLDEVDSTNAEAMRRAAAGERGPLWITARRQTAGRGRAGRTWGTPEGNLAATLLISPGCPPQALAGLSLVAGIATWEAVAALLPDAAGLRLKWPNDLLLGGSKLSGCLIESSVFAGETVAAIGIGINVAVAPSVPGRSVTCLAAHGSRATAEVVAISLRQSLTRWIGHWDRGNGLASIREVWVGSAGPLGEATTVSLGARTAAGTFAGLDHDGALLLRGDDGNVARITFGDVRVGTEA